MKSKRVKENPIMDNSKKIKRLKGSNFVSEEENEVKTFFIIIAVIAIIAGGIYFVTELLSDKNEIDPNAITAGSINYNKVSVGTILNRPYDNYYVLVYDSNSSEAVKYSNMMNLYMQKDEKNIKKIYFCDLSNALNSKYYNVNEDDKSNPNAKKIEDLDFGDLTLLEIKNGKIVNYLESYTSIHEKLK